MEKMKVSELTGAIKTQKEKKMRYGEWINTYFRYQEDKQPVVERDEEQEKIFEEYFVIKNIFKRNGVLLFLGIMGLIFGVLLIVVGLQDETLLPFGVILLVAGCVGLAAYELTKKVAPERVMTDEEYEEYVKNKYLIFNASQRAYEKLGNDSEQNEKTETISLRNKVFTDYSLKVYNSENKSIHSSTQGAIKLFFNEKQLVVYKAQFDMCCNVTDEWTSAFSYDEIVSVETHEKNRVIEVPGGKAECRMVAFEIVGVNSKIGFALDEKNPEVDCVQAITQKIRAHKIGNDN